MRRGDIFSFRLPKGIGDELHGKRYGVVVRSDALLPRSVVLIAPTSTSANNASFRPEIEVEGIETRVLVEQMGAVDIGRLGDMAGHLTSEEHWDVDAAMLTFWISTDRHRTSLTRKAELGAVGMSETSRNWRFRWS